MTRRLGLWLCFGASALVHGALGWQLCEGHPTPLAPRERETFVVHMVASTPPKAPDPQPAAPEPPPAPEPPKPKPKPKPEKAAASEPAPAAVAPAAPVAAAAVPEPVTSAPAALLAETGGAVGGVVQIAGAPVGVLVSSAPLARSEPARAAPAPLEPAPLAKLSDLSRKPRPPSLDQALRQNYPAALRRRGTEGQAEVRVVIDARGRVAELTTVSEGVAGFSDACKTTLLGSRWSEPLDRDGRPVSTRLTYRCRFQIER